MYIEYQILHPLSVTYPYAGFYKTDSKFSSGASWNEIMSLFFRERQNTKMPCTILFVCCSDCELFFLGGLPETGINACKCKDCGNEIVFRKQQTTKYVLSRPPLVGYKQEPGNIF